MLYFRCPTCKTELADKQIIYEALLDAVCECDQLTLEQKNLIKRKLLDIIGVERQCCRMRVLGYLRLVTIIR